MGTQRIINTIHQNAIVDMITELLVNFHWAYVVSYVEEKVQIRNRMPRMRAVCGSEDRVLCPEEDRLRLH